MTVTESCACGSTISISSRNITAIQNKIGAFHIWHSKCLKPTNQNNIDRSEV